jgi:hypothetical protein
MVSFYEYGDEPLQSLKAGFFFFTNYRNTEIFCIVITLFSSIFL